MGSNGTAPQSARLPRRAESHARLYVRYAVAKSSLASWVGPAAVRGHAARAELHVSRSPAAIVVYQPPRDSGLHEPRHDHRSIHRARSVEPVARRGLPPSLVATGRIRWQNPLERGRAQQLWLSFVRVVLQSRR